MRRLFVNYVIGGFVFLFTVLTPVSAQSFPTPTPNPSLTYYVDCINGVDTNNGTSVSSAWKTLTKANTAPLIPGDKLLLKKDCTWIGPLNATWNGTASNSITISAYGTGTSDPLIEYNAQNSVASRVNVTVTGSYQVIDHIRSSILNPKKNTLCTDLNSQATAEGWYVGFSLGGHHNTLQNSEAFGMALGINMVDGSHDNKILNNNIHDLRVLWRIFSTVAPDGQSATVANGGMMGAIGILIHGDDNEIAYNKFEKNGASCTYTDTITGTRLTAEYSAPFELYNANTINVHHNQAYGHRKHFEMGLDPDRTADDNTLAYNLFVSDQEKARGPNIHGTGDFGPVKRTKILNNTFVFTGANSEALICGCSFGATVQNNIFVAESKAAFFAGGLDPQYPLIESNNLYWDYKQVTDSTADPFVQFHDSAATTGPDTMNTTTGAATLAPNSFKVDPRLANPLLTPIILGNFRLQSTSPARDAGINLHYLKDLEGGIVPVGNGPDIGALEFTTTPQLVGDIVGNCQVDLADLSSLLGAFGTTNPTREVNGTAPINLSDLSLLLSNFGKRCS